MGGYVFVEVREKKVEFRLVRVSSVKVWELTQCCVMMGEC